MRTKLPRILQSAADLEQEERLSAAVHQMNADEAARAKELPVEELLGSTIPDELLDRPECTICHANESAIWEGGPPFDCDHTEYCQPCIRV
jgi:hypothetical protein